MAINLINHFVTIKGIPFGKLFYGLPLIALYVADYIEPNRDDIIPHIEDIQTLAFTDIDKAVCVISKNIIEYLEREGREIDPATRATYDFYRKLTEEK